jgi:hypothetical protein
MGYFLRVDLRFSEPLLMTWTRLYESMLDSVLHARDRFLKPGGLMAPSQCSILLAGGDDAAFMRDRIDYWRDVYGTCPHPRLASNAERLQASRCPRCRRSSMRTPSSTSSRPKAS